MTVYYGRRNKFFSNIEGLRNQGISLPYEQWQLDEIAKCRQDPIYFMNNYVKIRTLDDEEAIPFNTFGYQDKILRTFHENQKSIVMMSRQMGKTITTSAYILHSILFRAKFHVATLAYDLTSAKNNLRVVKDMYPELPYWMQQGVKKWSETGITLENGSTVMAAATTRTGIRGRTCNILYIDEFGMVDPSIANDFLISSYPVIFTSEKAKIIITSTPMGYNHFYDLWKDANDNKNGFVPVYVHYTEHPKRDDAWAKRQLETLGQVGFNQEVLCSFLGSSNTLIDSNVLKELKPATPIRSYDSMEIYKHPEPFHKYVIMVDTAEGIGQDSSAFTVIDISSRPFEVVARYKNPEISYLFFPDVIKNTAEDYNEAYVLVEVDSVGNQVAVILFNDLEYNNLFRFYADAKKGQILSNDWSKARYGLKMSSRVKNIGCRALKTLIEKRKLLLNDAEILHELKNFVEKGNTFVADSGYHDDLVMTLVSFAYLLQDKKFQEMVEMNREVEFGKEIKDATKNHINPALFYFDDGSLSLDTIDEDDVELMTNF